MALHNHQTVLSPVQLASITAYKIQSQYTYSIVDRLVLNVENQGHL